MASPLGSAKKKVDLTAPAVRVSRIRRDPPPKVREVTRAEIREREARTVAVGITLFALALVAILVGINSWSARPESQMTVTLNASMM